MIMVEEVAAAVMVVVADPKGKIQHFIPFQAILIQKYYRRWLAKNRVDKIRVAEKERREWEKEEELLKKKEKEARIQREYERRMNPKSKEDFDLLYHALESMFHSVFY